MFGGARVIGSSMLNVIAVGVPDWVPNEVVRISTSIRASARDEYEIEILNRLVFDEQMKWV
jgi:hypothetical protein